MMKILPNYGIDLVIIERKKVHNEAVSASQVRRLYESGDFEALKLLVPLPTYNYLFEKNKNVTT
jgi:citrate lyase synthetase